MRIEVTKLKQVINRRYITAKRLKLKTLAQALKEIHEDAIKLKKKIADLDKIEDENLSQIF